ncbi:MAG: bifunctional hydroxymethylpyrimidine kinase/phosphomethylpyrimidine kinase [Bacteroidaceae bacterium]
MYEEISILSINGSDSTACAGIQADARTITALGGYALTAITSVTVQDRCGISSVHDLPAHMVSGQVRAILSQEHPRAVKVGLLRHSDTLLAVAHELQDYPRVVMAPGLIASSGKPLVEPDVMRMWETALFPYAALLQLRVVEAENILGMRIRTDHDMERAARLLTSTGARSVLLRGGRLIQDRLTAFLLTDGQGQFFSSANMEGWQRHGVSSALSSAIATRMALGDSVTQAVSAAHAYMHNRVVYAVDNDSQALRPADIYNQYMSLIAAHHASIHRVGEYARLLAVSPRYLSMVTARVADRSPKQILDSCLTEKASALLLASHLTIQEISQRLGFTSQATFCMFFSKQTGLSPSAYRSRALSAQHPLP